MAPSSSTSSSSQRPTTARSKPTRPHKPARSPGAPCRHRPANGAQPPDPPLVTANAEQRLELCRPTTYRATTQTMRRDPAPFLPLTPAAFHVLLALADGPKHGY